MGGSEELIYRLIDNSVFGAEGAEKLCKEAADRLWELEAEIKYLKQLLDEYADTDQ